MGDPAGISPELLAKLLNQKELLALAAVTVIGDRRVLALGEQAAGVSARHRDGRRGGQGGGAAGASGVRRPEAPRSRHHPDGAGDRGGRQIRDAQFRRGAHRREGAPPRRHHVHAVQQARVQARRQSLSGRDPLGLRPARLERRVQRVQQARRSVERARDLARAAARRRRHADAGAHRGGDRGDGCDAARAPASSGRASRSRDSIRMPARAACSAARRST